jgi:hypothetical protein
VLCVDDKLEDVVGVSQTLWQRTPVVYLPVHNSYDGKVGRNKEECGGSSNTQANAGSLAVQRPAAESVAVSLLPIMASLTAYKLGT